MKKYLWVEDRFFEGADELRSVFERRFADPKATRSDRFVWDYWYVPDQYNLIRTPADHFFPANIYRAFLQRLAAWAQETLGCNSITPPWLSYYVDGCEQRLHSDVPHGPWAYVYSLSPKSLAFSGGETLLLRPATLDYWRNFREAQDREMDSFVERISPKFNRLVVFDPRIPHGVTPVRGSRDPREARLVIHGWFTDPRPYLKGPLRASRVAPLLDAAVGDFVADLAPYGIWHGVVSLRLKVSKSGELKSQKFLADTLVPVDADPALASEIRKMLTKRFREIRFPRAQGETEITLPLLFR